MQCSIEITPQQMADLMITCCEGGTNYWAEWIEITSGGLYSDPKTWEKPDWSIDVVHDDGEQAIVTPASFAKLTIHGKQALMRLIEGDFDATDADVILQELCFGELIYG